jgi:hypothetical protein
MRWGSQRGGGRGELEPTKQLRRERVSGQHLGNDGAGDQPPFPYDTGIIP